MPTGLTSSLFTLSIVATTSYLQFRSSHALIPAVPLLVYLASLSSSPGLRANASWALSDLLSQAEGLLMLQPYFAQTPIEATDDPSRG